MTEIPDQARELISEQIRAIEEAQAQIEKAMLPFRQALSVISGVRDSLCETFHVEIAGRCETCDKILFRGEQGHRDAEGIILCARHAPTYRDFQDAIEGGFVADDEADDCRAVIKVHLDGGGSLDDAVPLSDL